MLPFVVVVIVAVSLTHSITHSLTLCMCVIFFYLYLLHATTIATTTTATTGNNWLIKFQRYIGPSIYVYVHMCISETYGGRRGGTVFFRLFLQYFFLSISYTKFYTNCTLDFYYFVHFNDNFGRIFFLHFFKIVKKRTLSALIPFRFFSYFFFLFGYNFLLSRIDVHTIIKISPSEYTFPMREREREKKWRRKKHNKIASYKDFGILDPFLSPFIFVWIFFLFSSHFFSLCSVCLFRWFVVFLLMRSTQLTKFYKHDFFHNIYS